ncbi:FKBP-type peptidyl-prolyl cis-trans isomerase [Facilibium subflavum]|uniref:FKBP-type peptidyl-prolyl cis-trans isomerase n=1 Tax=Facilibium subflavum TaxID=2219058 RepID=UPI000E658380|nr:FKBP-type peptidyl-prolyl cis-trans isomerase [Facilibium subflavum]
MKKIATLAMATLLAGSISAYAAGTNTDTSAKMTKPAAAKQDSQPTKVDLNKVSYIIGYEMGKGFKSQNIALNVKELQSGIKTALAGKDSKISKEDAKQIMQAFQQEMIQKAQVKLKEESTVNEKSSDTFMAAVAKIPGIKKVNDDVYYQVLTKGDGKAPAKDDMVTVDYTGTTPAKAFKDDKNALDQIKQGKLLGKVFDSSKKTGKPATFPLNQVIPCWTDSLSQIPVGSEVILYCAPKAAYGEMAPPQIGPNQVLSFKVKLISAKAAQSDNDNTKAKIKADTAKK